MTRAARTVLIVIGKDPCNLHALNAAHLSGKTACNVSLAFEEMATNVIKYYLPFLIVSGVIAGVVIGIIAAIMVKRVNVEC